MRGCSSQAHWVGGAVEWSMPLKASGDGVRRAGDRLYQAARVLIAPKVLLHSSLRDFVWVVRRFGACKTPISSHDFCTSSNPGASHVSRSTTTS